MMKKRLLNPTETVLWVILILATIVSLTVFEDTAARIAASVAIVIGMFKARIIFIYFMEVRVDPRLRIVNEIWTLLVGSIILGGYWLTALNS